MTGNWEELPNCGHSGGLFIYYNTEILKQILISKFGHKIQPRNSSKDYETLKIYLDIYIFQKKNFSFNTSFMVIIFVTVSLYAKL